MFIRVIVFILALLPSLTLANKINGKEWFNYSSKYFDVYFNSNTSDLAIDNKEFFDEQYEKLSKKLNWQADGKIAVVINDDHDMLNGYATVAPRKKIYLNSFNGSIPERGFTDSVEDMRITFIHELTHVIHLDMTSGAPNFLKNTFGRGTSGYNKLISFFATPNLVQPLWLIEGLAVFYETELTNAGRGDSTSYEMQMRAEVERGLRDIGEINIATSRDWPIGKSYLYGYYFYKFVQETYGDAKIKELIKQQSGNIIPGSYNLSIKKVFGRNIVSLWDQFKDYLISNFSENKTAFSGNIKNGVPFNNIAGYLGDSEVVSNDGFIVTENTRADRQKIIHIDKNGRRRTIKSFNNPHKIDMSIHKNKIIFTKLDYNNRYQFYSDLYMMDLSGRRLKRLSKDKRFYSATWNTRQNKIIASQFFANKWRLVQLSKKGKIEKILWEGNNSEVISSISYSKDRNTVLTCMQSPMFGKIVFAEFNLTNKSWQLLLPDDSVIANPKYSADSKYLFYTSDKNGIYNIKRIDLASLNVDLITNLTSSSGGFKPCYLPSTDEVVYFRYTPEGYKLNKIANKSIERLPKGKIVSWPKNNIKEGADSDTIINSYAAINSLSPNSWFPYPASTEGEDVLGIHRYTAFMTSSRFNIEYTYLANSKIGYSRDFSKFNLFDADSVFYVNQRINLISSLERQLSLLLNFEYSIYKSKPNMRYKTSPSLGLNYSSTFTGINSTTPKYGSDIFFIAGYESNHDPFLYKIVKDNLKELFGKSIDYQVENNKFCRFTWSEYFSLPNNNILKLQVTEAFSENKGLSLGGSDNQDIFAPNINLRGFKDDYQTGNRVETFTAEYIFPIYSGNRGFACFPLGIKQIKGATFLDIGAAWSDRLRPESHLYSVGAEISFVTNLFYVSDVEYKFGYGRSINHTPSSSRAWFTVAIPLG